MPRALVEDASWHLFKVRPWKFPEEHIIYKEGRAEVYVYEEVASLPQCFGHRVLILGDNETSAHAHQSSLHELHPARHHGARGLSGAL